MSSPASNYLLLMPCDAWRSASELRKRMDTIAELTGTESLFVIAAMNPSEHKRLIDQHVSFIVPGNQLYLPNIAIDLREYFRSRRQPVNKGGVKNVHFCIRSAEQFRLNNCSADNNHLCISDLG